jgi:hypothetical protein
MPRPRLSRPSRSRLLWLLAAFVLSQGALAVAIDGWLDAVRDPEHATKLARLRERLRAAPDRPLVLVLGSSRTAYGMNAWRLSKPHYNPEPIVFNFGLMGGGPLLQTVTLRRLLAEGIRPGLVYAELMPAHLLQWRGRLQEEKLLDGARLRGGEVRWLWRFYHEPRRLVWGWLLGRLLPCYRHQAELREHLGMEPADMETNPNNPGYLDSHGWRARTDSVTAAYCRKATAIALGQYAEPCTSTQVGEEVVRALEELLELCRREGIPVTLVLMPEGKPFRDLYSPQARAACASVLDRLQARWGVRVVDARDWVADSGFWDTHHLLPEGAEQFTERFGREVLPPDLERLKQARRARARP